MVAKILLLFLLNALVSAAYGAPKGCTTPEGLSGTCIPRKSCSEFVEILSRAQFSSPQKKREFAQSYRCAGNNICCFSDTVYSEPPPSVENHKNLRLLPSLRDCGESGSDKLHGADLTKPLEYPWMALISTNSSGDVDFTCGGSIVNDRYILTAAHCITQLGKRVLVGVRLGEHDISEDKDCSNDDDCADEVQDIAIERVIVHPKYIGKRNGKIQDLTNDIGLIRLAEPINMELNNVLPVCLPVIKQMRDLKLEDKNLTVTGWGRTNVGRDGVIYEGLNNLSSTLLVVNIPFVTNIECARSYNNSGFGGIGFRHLCAGGQKGISSCDGDSGGPLTASDSFGTKLVRVVQYGVVSAGVGSCGTDGRPGIFTNVVYYMDWILDQLKP